LGKNEDTPSKKGHACTVKKRKEKTSEVIARGTNHVSVPTVPRSNSERTPLTSWEFKGKMKGEQSVGGGGVQKKSFVAEFKQPESDLFFPGKTQSKRKGG